MSDARRERRLLERRHPEAFKQGMRAGAGIASGYPKGFHQWEEERRNAWWAGANLGYLMKTGGREVDNG